MNLTNLSKKNNVKYHIECLRIIAILFVMFNHTGTAGFILFSVREESPYYWMYLFISILCKVAVPLFYMISGALLLPMDESYKNLYKKRVLKFLAVLLLFSFFQYLYTIFKSDTAFNMMTYFKTVYSSNMALAYWYLYSYLGILVMLPFLRNMVRVMRKNDYLYLFLCQFIIVSVIPILQYLVAKGNYNLNSFFSVPIITSSCIFYFLIGHFFENILEENKYNIKSAILLILSSVIAIFISCFMTYYRTQIVGVCTENDAQAFHNTMISIPTFTIYYCAKYIFIKIQLKDNIKKILSYIGSLTFGIMLVENILRAELLFIYNWLIQSLSSIFSCIIYIIIAFIFGVLITSIFKLMPVLKKII